MCPDWLYDEAAEALCVTHDLDDPAVALYLAEVAKDRAEAK